MTLRDLIKALPKVELNLQLTGALRKESLLLIANQNGIPAQMDDFAHWVDMLDKPDPASYDEIAAVAGSWIMYPEDIALAVYDIGVALSKHNIPYAEVSVVPSDYVGSARMNFDTFINALNDGRDRALRAWNVDMSWIFCIPRDNPRVGDDVARWATGSAARQGNVVALGLTGQEESQPVGQFKRAFGTAQKKELQTVVGAGDNLGASGIRDAVEELQPNRLVSNWRSADAEAAIKAIADSVTPAVVSVTRAISTGLAPQASDFPLQLLSESDALIALSCDRPSLYQSSLIDEYASAGEDCGIGAEQLIRLARAAIELSFMDAERKENMLRDFDLAAKAALGKFLSGN